MLTKVLKKTFSKKHLNIKSFSNKNVQNDNVVKSIDEIIDIWRNTGIKLNAPATIDVLKKVQENINFQFPDDFINFYLRINGFKDWDMTNEMFSIWTLERIEEEVLKSDNTNFIPFCDYLINSYRYGFHKDKLGIYKEYYSDMTYKMTDTFEEIIKLIYLDSSSLH